MHAVDLAGLANLLVRNAPALAAVKHRPNQDSMQAYWLNCRFRHDNWIQRLAKHRTDIQDSGVSVRNRRWHEVLPVIQEVLMSEPLARCMAYYAAMRDQRCSEVCGEAAGNSELAALTQSVFSSHVEARHRCLHLIVFGQGLSVEHAVKLNRMRRALENYTDQLLALMFPISRLVDYSFNHQSVSNSQRQLSSGHLAAGFVRLQTSAIGHALWNSIRSELDWRAANGRLNHKISQSILGLLPSELFDHFGIAKSHHLLAMERTSQESTGKCSDFLAPLEHPLNVLFAEPRRLAAASKSKPRW